MDRTPVRALALAAGTVAALCAPAAASAAAPPDHNPNGHTANGHAAPASRQAPADPPGNNGTIKVDAQPFDTHPGNEPHVDCSFQIDFYGFDEGDLVADVVFEGHAPTGGGVLLTDEVFIGEDGNEGGGAEAGLDAQVTYDLSGALAGIEPHPQQGWHVKLTIHAEGSQGADVKHKVFWVDGCSPEAADVPAPEAATATATPANAAENTATGTAAVAGTATMPPAQDAAPASVAPVADSTGAPAPIGVLGLQVEPPRSAADAGRAPEVAGVQLARTGIDAGLLAAIGLGLVLSGRALVRRPASG